MAKISYEIDNRYSDANLCNEYILLSIGVSRTLLSYQNIFYSEKALARSEGETSRLRVQYSIALRTAHDKKEKGVFEDELEARLTLESVLHNKIKRLEIRRIRGLLPDALG